jgi:lathosterol oxidase
LAKVKFRGAISIFLGLLSIISLLCFRFPEYLTTPDFCEIYTGEMVERIMFGAIIVSLVFALVSFLLSKKKKMELIGLSLCVVTIALGGFSVEGRSVDKVNWSIGLDWMILDLLMMAFLFVPVELALPKNDKQAFMKNGEQTLSIS